jgi:hypothetical protein
LRLEKCPHMPTYWREEKSEEKSEEEREDSYQPVN